MLDYNDFKEAIKEKMKERLSQAYPDAKVEIDQANKINRQLDMLICTIRDSKNGSLTPALALQELYEDYSHMLDMDAVLDKAVETLMSAAKRNIGPLPDFRTAKDNIIPQLINTEQNKGLLETLPHRKFHDLSIIYRWVLRISGQDMASIMVNGPLAEKIKMDEEQLFQASLENMKRLMPPKIKTIDDTLLELAKKSAVDEADMKNMTGAIHRTQLYVLTNQYNFNGANAVLCDEALSELADWLGDDLYIMPSSIHEVLAVPVNAYAPDSLEEIVSYVNMAHVRLEDRLSNQIYYYDHLMHVLSMATDSPNKRIDGAVQVE